MRYNYKLYNKYPMLCIQPNCEFDRLVDKDTFFNHNRHKMASLKIFKSSMQINLLK